MTQLPGRKPSTFSPKTEITPDDSVLLAQERLMSLDLLRNIIVTDAVTQLREEFNEGYPDVPGLNPTGEWRAGVTYNRNDLVSYTLPDGRVGSYVARAANDTEPTNVDNWQVIAAPAGGAGGGSADGYTAVNLQTTTGNTFAVNLALEDRFHIRRNTTGSGSITFSNLASLGNATVALYNPGDGVSAPFTWPSNLIWEGGVTPALSTTPGQGDVFLFRSWDGQQVVGIQSQQNVRFERVASTSIAGATALWRFPSGGNNLVNSLKPGTNDFITSTGAERSPFGREIAAGGVINTGRLLNPDTLAHVNFSAAWSFLYVAPGLYADAQLSNTSVFSFSATSEDPSANYRHLRLYTNTSSGVPALHMAARDVGHTGGVVGPKDANGQAIGTLPLKNRPVHMLYVEYDGAGQFQVTSVGEGVSLLDKTTGTAGNPDTWLPLENRFIDGDTTFLPDYTAGMLFSAAPTQRLTTVVGTLSAAHLRWMHFVPRVLTLAERNEMYDAARNYMLTVDPNGPQLPARA